jgi:trimeric autotransporter adhesin
MSPLIQLKKTTPAILVAVACFGLSSMAQALLPPPPPDGGYLNQNTAEGDGALFSLTTGGSNTATGVQALLFNTSGGSNTATGRAALHDNTGGSLNTANGTEALYNNTTAFFNTAMGFQALYNNTTGLSNTANGYQALYLNTTGGSNTATGVQALYQTTGGGNIALGFQAGVNLTTGNNNIDIGNAGVAGESSKIRIGRQGTHNGTFIAGISGSPIAGTSVVVNNNGRLGTVASSQRFKDDIKPIDKASEAIHALKPVMFRYKKEVDPEGIPQFGLVAEEAEKANPDLVVRDKEGKPYSVRYDAVNAMLLNEFLKARRQIDAQQKQIDALTAGLQRVSVQFEASKPAPQMVNNP